MTGWLLTWLWQGGVVTLIVLAALKVARINAATRHLIWWAALAAVVWLGYQGSPFRRLTPAAESGYVSGVVGLAAEPLLQVQELSPSLISVLLGIWAAVALIKLIRLVPSLHAVYRLRDRCRPFPSEIEAQLPLWLDANARARRPADLKMCDHVAGATVLGFQRPCIALPTSLVSALRPEELDQIVLHEHAHVQRRDDWARLAQMLLQAALWIHPAVRFIGRALNREREMACDQWVIARTGLPKAYARCLILAADVRGRIRLEPAIVPALIERQHDLVRRVDELLRLKGRAPHSASWLAVMVAACSMAAMSLHLNAMPFFGEYVEMVLPTVPSPARIAGRPQPVAHDAGAIYLAESIQATSAPRRLLSARLGHEPYELNEPYELHEPNELHDRAEPNRSRESRPVLSSRAFEGAYLPSIPAAAPSDKPGGWKAAATPGVEIASAARRTSVGLAGALTRASVSIAKSFR